MPTVDEARAHCAAILAGLDDDTLEYVAGAVFDDEDAGTVLPEDDLVDFLVPMLDELCDGEEEVVLLGHHHQRHDVICVALEY